MATIPTETHPSSEHIANTQRRYTVGYVPNLFYRLFRVYGVIALKDSF